MPMLTFPVEKIHGEDLRQFAVEPSPEVTSVIIEPDLPLRQVGLRKEGEFFGRSAFEVVPETPEQRREVERKTAEAVEFLTGILGAPPHWLKAARAFVAAVNGAQLQAIARSPSIKAIRPNRRRAL